MTTDMESLLDGTPVGAADDQRISWDYRSWCDGLVGGASAEVRDVLEAIEDRWALDSGISRAAVIEVADGDPVRLLLSSMVWGFGTIPYGPARTSKMLGAPQLRETLADIATAARTSAELGFSSLFRHGRFPSAGTQHRDGVEVHLLRSRRVGGDAWIAPGVRPQRLLVSQEHRWRVGGSTEPEEGAVVGDVRRLRQLRRRPREHASTVAG